MTTLEGVMLFQLGLLIIISIRLEMLHKRQKEELERFELLLKFPRISSGLVPYTRTLVEECNKNTLTLP